MNIAQRAAALFVSAFVAWTTPGSQAQAATEAPGYTVEPAPAWVVPAVESSTAQPYRAGMHYRVIDQQLRIEGRSQLDYTHLVRVADDAAGLATASQIEIEFDPSYQSLALHHLEVTRDGKHSDRLTGRKFQVLQRETQLERNIYDGRATLSVVLDDVRVGDQIDIAYTIRGANPVFDGKFVFTTWMTSQRGPVTLYQMRLLAPVDRQIELRTGSPDMAVRSSIAHGLRETVVRRDAVQQLDVEPGAPYSALLEQQVQFSEFADWAAVSRWAEGVFAQGNGGDAVERKAEEIRKGSPGRSERLLAALRFVQRDIRYFGNEFGVSSHRPEAPDRVLERRFGDCKDKVTLLIALLRRLDIPAQPVLVSTFQRGGIDRLLPSPLAFNHVIARVDLDGASYWLDGTRTHQSGPLSARQSEGYGRGLVVAPATQALADLPPAYDSEQVGVNDTIRVERFVADPVLVSRITYRGDLAEAYRQLLTSRSLQEIGNDLASPYMKVYPGLRTRSPPRVEEAADDGSITFVQEFYIPAFWRFPEQKQLVADIVEWAALDALSFPRSDRRRAPLAFSRPGKYRHTITVQFPEDVFAQPTSEHFEDGDSHLVLKTLLEGDLRRTSYTAEVRFGADEVEPEDWTAFSAKVAQLRRKLSLTTGAPSFPIERIDELNRELRAAEYSVRSKRLQLGSDEQVQALYKSISLTARIDGGRLPPALLAEAYGARGIAYERLGRQEDASNDFDKALALAPDADDAVNAAAAHSFRVLDLDRTLERANRVLKHSPRDDVALQFRALAHYFRGESAPCEADLLELLKQGNAVRRGYPMVWLTLAMRQTGKDAAALEKRYPPTLWPSEWPRPLVDLMFGKTTPEAVIQAAGTQKQSARSLGESYFFIGEMYRASGDPVRAAEYWKKSLDTGESGRIEFTAARLRLDKVGQP